MSADKGDNKEVEKPEEPGKGNRSLHTEKNNNYSIDSENLEKDKLEQKPVDFSGLRDNYKNLEEWNDIEAINDLDSLEDDKPDALEESATDQESDDKPKANIPPAPPKGGNSEFTNAAEFRDSLQQQFNINNPHSGRDLIGKQTSFYTGDQINVDNPSAGRDVVAEQNNYIIGSSDNVDPTRPLLVSSKNVLKAEQTAYYKTNLSKTFEKERVLVVSCLHKAAAEQVVQAILNEQIKADYDKRYLSYMDTAREKMEKLDISIFTIPEKKIGKNKYVATKVHIKKDVFFQNLFVDKDDLQYLQTTLQEKKFFVICYFDQPDWCKKIAERTDFPHLHWSLPFLEPMVHEHFHEADEAKSIIKQLEVQRSDGLWPDGDVDFYKELSVYLGRGKTHFKRELEFRRSSTNRGAKSDSTESINYRDNAFAIVEKSKLNRDLIYLTIFFPGLHFTEFNRLMKIITEGQEIKVKVKTKKNKKKLKTKDVFAYWEENADGHLRKCGLTLTRDTDNKTKIAFEDVRFGQEARQLINDYYWVSGIDNFKRIFYSGIFLHQDTSDTLEYNLVKLFTEAALDNPNILSRNMLFDLFHHSLKEEGLPNQIIEGKESKEWVQYQLSRLIQSMLAKNEAALNQTITDFLDYLLDNYPLELCDLIRLMESSPWFHEKEWILKLLTSENFEVQKKAFLILLHISEEKPHRIYNYLEEFYHQVESKDGDEQENSLSTLFVSLFPYYYLTRVHHRIKPEDYGTWPSPHPILVNLHKEGDADTRFEMLIQWLFHNKAESAFIRLNTMELISEKKLRSEDKEGLIRWMKWLYWVHTAKFLPEAEEWSQEQLWVNITETLEGIFRQELKSSRAKLLEMFARICVDAESPSGRAKEIYQLFLKNLINEISIHKRRELQQEFGKRKQNYLLEADKAVKKGDFKKRRKVLASRRFLKRFSADLREAVIKSKQQST